MPVIMHRGTSLYQSMGRYKEIPKSEEDLVAQVDPAAHTLQGVTDRLTKKNNEPIAIPNTVLEPYSREEIIAKHPHLYGKSLQNFIDSKPMKQVPQKDANGNPTYTWLKPKDEGMNILQDTAKKLRVPFITDEGTQDVKDALKATGVTSAAHGVGLVGGGIAGMLGGGWLTDKLLALAVSKRNLKKNQGMYQLIRDMGTVAGMGLGAYGGLKAVNKYGPLPGPGHGVSPGATPIVAATP